MQQKTNGEVAFLRGKDKLLVEQSWKQLDSLHSYFSWVHGEGDKVIVSILKGVS